MRSKTRWLFPSDSNIFVKRRPVAEKYRMKADKLGMNDSKSRWLCPGEAKPLDSVLALKKRGLSLFIKRGCPLFLLRARSSFIRTSRHSLLVLEKK